MSILATGQFNARSTVISLLSTALVLSLVCSMSVQYGHADTPVAATAEEIQPLVAGDIAPRFTVETVDHEPLVF